MPNVDKVNRSKAQTLAGRWISVMNDSDLIYQVCCTTEDSHMWLAPFIKAKHQKGELERVRERETEREERESERGRETEKQRKGELKREAERGYRKTWHLSFGHVRQESRNISQIGVGCSWGTCRKLKLWFRGRGPWPFMVLWLWLYLWPPTVRASMKTLTDVWSSLFLQIQRNTIHIGFAKPCEAALDIIPVWFYDVWCFQDIRPDRWFWKFCFSCGAARTEGLP